MTWLEHNAHIHSVRAAACDLNAQARGKRIPRRYAGRLETEGTRFPFSALNLDIWGDDIEDSPLVFASGDRDGLLRPTERGFVPMPWLDTPTALLPLWMFDESGAPFAGDPRHALAAVLARYRARGLTPVVATELEFYLVDDSTPLLRAPASPKSGKRRPGAETLAMRQLDAFDAFFTAVYDGCKAMDVPADTAISEAGPGQFEINMMHGPDALRAADDAWLFKLLVRGLARRHGFAATFMAKPYPDYAGNGFHVHVSVVDGDGRNVFDDGTARGTDALGHAVAGCLAAAPASTLVFAPHAGSYDRLVPGAHAPTGLAWAYENRTTALRIPSGPARRPAARAPHRGRRREPLPAARRHPRRDARGDRAPPRPARPRDGQRLRDGPAAHPGDMERGRGPVRGRPLGAAPPAGRPAREPRAHEAAGDALRGRARRRRAGRALPRRGVTARCPPPGRAQQGWPSSIAQ